MGKPIIHINVGTIGHVDVGATARLSCIIEELSESENVDIILTDGVGLGYEINIDDYRDERIDEHPHPHRGKRRREW